MADSRPNVLLIVVDQMRRDALGLNGRDFRVHTSHLGQLAREGVNFAPACSACPSCIAARAGLMTGLEPFRHGFTGYDARPEWRARLAERLRDRPEGFVEGGELMAGRSQISSQSWAGIGR